MPGQGLIYAGKLNGDHLLFFLSEYNKPPVPPALQLTFYYADEHNSNERHPPQGRQTSGLLTLRWMRSSRLNATVAYGNTAILFIILNRWETEGTTSLILTCTILMTSLTEGVARP